jgi:hypothetical protein
MSNRARRMTREEQEQLGLLRPALPSTFVPATRQTPDLPAQTNYGVSLDIPLFLSSYTESTVCRAACVRSGVVASNGQS